MSSSTGTDCAVTLIVGLCVGVLLVIVLIVVEAMQHAHRAELDRLLQAIP